MIIPALLLHTQWGYPFPSGQTLNPTMPEEDVDGHACYHVSEAGGNLANFWIDRKTFLLRRVVEEAAGGDLHKDARFTNEILNAPISDSVFAAPSAGQPPQAAVPAPKVVVALTEVKQSNEADSWKPTNAQLRHLAPNSVMPGFTVRPPRGYGEKTFTSFAADSRMDTYAWSLPRRADGTTSFFQVVRITKGAPAKSLDQLAVNEWQQTRKELAAAPISDAVLGKEEAGIIDSIPFRRIHWQGTYRPAKGAAQKRQGFSYVGMVGAQDWLYFESSDCDPYVQETLPMTEAALLTFQRK
jgi:hypothetical protein